MPPSFRWALGLLLLFSWQGSSSAFITNGRWSVTATDGTTGPVGTPITLTWGIVPDGTFIPGEGGSNLISFFDSLFGDGGGGGDLTQRPWFEFLDSSFNRWAELSGMTTVFEPADDGVNLRGLQGALGVRADVRIGGAFLDGPSGTLASIGFIPDSDLTIDTGDGAYYSNPDPFDTFQNIRNTLTHEIGHALGLAHLDSPSIFLMEPFTSAAINGPQLDDIRGVQQLYGDALEKGNGFLGNGSAATATELGTLSPGDSITMGNDAATGLFVFPGETDFVSISNQFDNDFFRFETTTATLLDVSITPVGATYQQRPGPFGPFTTIDSSAISDLTLEVFGLEGGLLTSLALADATGLGEAEAVTSLALPEPGSYFLQVSGDATDVQMYQLDLELAQGGDFDGDGDVDVADLQALQRGVGGGFNAGNLQLWQGGFGQGQQVLRAATVPEPGITTMAIALVVCLTTLWRSSAP